ncbi:MAG TPA: hypothetical protein VGX50_03680 [Longimicrobium sp.]|nr:hypothetical protein [Longimicrobium sp.]
MKADRGVDFVVRSPDDDRVVLAVEAKRQINASPEWAAEMRRNLSVQGVLPETPYFLLASPEQFYLWKCAPAQQPVPPDFAFDAADALRPYLDRIRFSLDELSPAGFDSLVWLWLEDLVRENGTGQATWLRASGLDKHLRGAIVTAQLPA